MTPDPRRPASLSMAAANALPGLDPAERLVAAHTSAQAVVARLRDGSDPAAGERMVAAVDTDEGLDAAARLWSVASAVSLPGALWRLVALRAGVRRAPARASQEFDVGRARLPVAEAIAGVAQPPGPDEVSAMVDAVLRGVGDGDLDVTFDRAAAFARVCSVGRAVLVDRDDVPPGAVDPVADLDAELDAARLTRSASALVRTAEELEACARRWRRHELD